MVEEQRRELEIACNNGGAQGKRDRHGLVSQMLLTYPTPGASAESGRARSEAYADALEDLPAWAVAAAIRYWHRGECGEHDYRWAPAPATLRALAREQLVPYHRASDHLTRLLSAVSQEEAMQGCPQQDREYVETGFSKLSAHLNTAPHARTPAREAAE